MFTNCVTPPELDDQQLLAYLDDPEANQATAQHIARCPYCREKATALDRLQKRMTSSLYRITCPPPVELGEYHLHLLPASRSLVVGQHIRECPSCASEMDQLTEFLSGPTPGAERNLVQQTKILIAQLVSGRGGSSAADEPAYALRGESQGPVIFEAEGIAIILDMQLADEKKVNILGQIAADDQEGWTGATAKLEQTDGYEKTEVVDDLGAFRFEEELSGSVKITITSPHGMKVQIPNIDINV